MGIFLSVKYEEKLPKDKNEDGFLSYHCHNTALPSAHATHRYCPVRNDYSYLANRATTGISGQGVGSHQAADQSFKLKVRVRTEAKG